MKSATANLFGLSSIFIWASLVGAVKIVTELLPHILAIALIYSCSAMCMISINPKSLKQVFPKPYLFLCGSCFVLYEILFLGSISLSKTRQETLILSMINYLWPCLTLFFSYLAKQLHFKPFAFLGIFISVFGLLLTINPDFLNLPLLLQSIQNNPPAYSMAFIAAILWAIYCVYTKKLSQGTNAVPLFFCLTAIGLWILFYFSPHETWQPPTIHLGLFILVMGALIGTAYKNWTTSLQFGNIQLLLLASYLTPILSTLFSSLILHTFPQWTFWTGTLLVSFGAILCWRFSEPIG